MVEPVRPDVQVLVDAVEDAVTGTSFAGVQQAGGGDPHPVWCGDPVEVARAFPDLLRGMDENGAARSWASQVPCVDLVVEISDGALLNVTLEGVPVGDLLEALGRPAEASALRAVIGTSPDLAAGVLGRSLMPVMAALRP